MHQVKIEELENGLKITETIGSDIIIRYLTTYAYPFIRSTNEAGQTYQVVDTVGEIYNLPAVPTEFLLISLGGQSYTPGNGDELVEDSLKLKPFRRDNLLDRVVSIGTVTATSSIAKLGLDISGVNAVLIGGNLREKYVEDNFSFTPVVSNQKILIIYATDSPNIFHLAEGLEAVEAVEPDYAGLFVARILVSTSAPVIDTGSGNGYKQQADDNWRNVIIGSNAGAYLPATTRPSSFHVTYGEAITTPKIFGLEVGAKIYAWPGKAFTVFTEKDTMLEAPATFGATVLPFEGGTSYLAKAGTYIRMQIKYGKLVVTTSSGGASFPPAIEGQVFVQGATEVVASDRLTVAESAITTEKNRNDVQDLAITALQTQHYKTISGNVTIDDTYHNTLWKITANAIITVPSTLRADFIAGFEVIGSFEGTFTEGSGVTFSAPFGKVCTADSSGIIYKNGSATFRLKTT